MREKEGNEEERERNNIMMNECKERKRVRRDNRMCKERKDKRM